LIVNRLNRIFRAMSGAEPMLKHAQRDVPVAKPSGKPIDINAGYERVMGRFPRIMARLAQ
jgi:hypothetical protein